MVSKKAQDNPTIKDTVVFDLITPNQLRVEQNPSNIEKILIYQLETSHHKEKREVYKKEFTSTISQPIYFNEAVPVYMLGDEQKPAWTAENPGQIKNLAPGRFELNWLPLGRREGNYIITWSYRSTEGILQSQNMHFCLASEPSDNVLSPQHRTEPDKYKILLEKYLPTPYKTEVSEDDLTPYIIEKLHHAIDETN